MVDKNEVKAKIMEFYDLDIDADVLGGKGDTLTKADLEAFLVEAK